MKNLRLKIILAVIGVVLFYTALMWLYHGLYVMRDSAALTHGLVRFLGIVFGVVAVTLVVLLFIIRPLMRITKKMDKGDAVTEEEAFIARKTISKIPVLIIVSYAVGFFIGPIISAVLRSFAERRPVDVLDTAITLFYDMSIGLVAALQAIHVLDIVTLTTKEKLKTLKFDDRLKDRGIRRKNMLVVACSVYFAAALLVAAGYGMVTRGPVSTYAYLWQMGVLSLVIFGIVYVLNFTVASLQRAQITRLTEGMEKTASAGADLSERLSVIQFDEIGMLTHHINSFMGKLKELLFTIGKAANRVTESSDELNKAAASSAGIVERLVSSMDTIRTDTEEQAEITTGTEKAIDAILASIEKVSDHVETQAAYVEQSSAAITEMTSNIGSVSKITSQADELARTLLVVAKEGGEAISSTLSAIRDIEGASVKVREIIGVISKIAAQTNMLAMNAAIEAAHAGESGRGFAVVADEVRKLAEDSARSTKDIVEHIKKMISRIEHGVGLAEKAREAFSTVSEDIYQTSNLMQTISSAMEEQKIGADEILGSVDSLVEATEDIKQLAGDQAEKSGDMRKAMGKLVGASQSIQKSLKEQAESNTAIVDMVENLRHVSQENSSIVEDLLKLVSKI